MQANGESKLLAMESSCRCPLTIGFAGAALWGILLGAPSVQAFRAPVSLARLERQIKVAISRVRPAVVKISALSGQAKGLPVSAGTPAALATPYRSIGSGLIVHPGGYVVTNAHVIGDSSSIRVTLWRTPPVDLRGRVLHKSEQQDLAVIRLDGNGPFPYASLGDSTVVEVGQRVIAIGSPYGLEHSVSMGIVSDRVRSLWIDGQQYRDLVQTDAAINQGNSGGPLINLNGEVVGVSTAIYAPRGVFAGVGFAIPIDRAHSYLTSVLPGHGLGLAAAQYEKEPIPAGAPAPHPPAGKCSSCHIIQPRAAGKPAGLQVRTVRALVPAMPAPDAFTTRPGRPFFHLRPARASLTHKERDWYAIQRGAALVFAAAVLFNMLGIGGGYIYVPLLLLLGIGFHTASATSLFIIAAAHLSGLTVFLRSGLIDYRLALILGPLTALGAFLGGLSSAWVGEAPLSVMFGGVLLGAGYLMQKRPDELKAVSLATGGRWSWQYAFGDAAHAIDLPVGLPVVLGVGYLGGLLGFAGGVVTVPMMVLLFGVPIKVAIATSSLMVSVTSMLGCVGHAVAGHFDPLLAVALALSAMVGAQFGARLTIKADHLLLKRMFAVVLLVVAMWMIARVL